MRHRGMGRDQRDSYGPFDPDMRLRELTAAEKRAAYEYLRYLTGLATGSLVLLTLFLKDVFASPPAWSALIFITL